jgi:enoyl-CoA hydratase/carnithine racemase
MRLDTVSIEKQDGGVALVTLGAFALTRQLGYDIAMAVNTLMHDPQVRVVVVTGRKNVFLSGVALGEIRRLSSAAAANKILEVPRLTTRNLIVCPKPTLAAVNGFCLGAGAELAVACDLRVCADEVRNAAGESVPFIGFLHAQRGLSPHLAGSQLLPRLVGPARAKDLLMTARLLGSAEALAIGLVDRVVDAARVCAEAVALARVIARQDPHALRLIKDLVQRSQAWSSFEEGLAWERDAFGRCRDAAGGARPARAEARLAPATEGDPTVHASPAVTGR